jgi:2-oxoisovalerate dehydrogenase E1 component alpha subunit
MPGFVVDGADVLECYRVAKEAVDRARRGEGPTLIEAKVIRLTAHSSDDQQTKYRTAEELADMANKDPLPRYREQLREAGVLTEEAEAKIAAEVKAAVEDATTYAEEAPEPDPTTAMQWVFAEEWPGETPPPWGFTLRGTGGH